MKSHMRAHTCNYIQQELFVSEKFRQKRPSGCSSGIYFRQTLVGSRLLFSRSIVALLIVVHFYIHDRIFLTPLFRFVKKISQEFNLVKNLLDESDETKFLTKISCNTVHDEEEEDDDETIKKKGLKEPGL